MPKLPPVNRRSFVRLMLAGGAGSLAGCVREQRQTIVSPVDRPEEMVPGRILEYATVCRACPAGCGLLVRTNEARATKLEGIADHPVNRGALCARGHAELQRLYSPDRLREPLARGADGTLRPARWDEVMARVAAALAGSDAPTPFAVISRGLGPTMRELLERLCAAATGELYEYEPYPYAALRTASRIAFGHQGLWRPRFDNARMVLSFGADFLETWLSPVANARGYARARRYHEGSIGLHTQVEPRLSLTGANADEWLTIRPGSEHVLALGLLRTILHERLDVGLDADARAALERLAAPYDVAAVEEATGVPAAQAVHLARTFALTRPALALPPGLASSGTATTAAHLATLLLNLAVGAIPQALEFVRAPLLEHLSTPAQLEALRARLTDGGVRLLLLHDTNPLPSLPDGPAWEAALASAPLVVALASTLDETAARADIVLPISAPIESWDDFEPYVGVTGLQQPAMRPLEGTRNAGDLLLELAGQAGGEAASALPWTSFTDLLRDRWADIQATEAPGSDFEGFWQESLQRGGRWREPESLPVTPTADLLAGEWLAEADRALHDRATTAGDSVESAELELILAPSLHHFDGGREPTGWLQEVPDPLAQVAWSPWVELHPDTARRHGIAEGDLVAVESPRGLVRAPALLNRWLLPDAVALPLGPRYDVRDAGQERSSPAHLLAARYEPLSGEVLWAGTRVAVRRLGPRNQLLSPRASLDQAQRPLAQTVAVAALRRAEADGGKGEHRGGLYSEHEHPDHRWGMVIDTHACIGCNACTIACYAENNIPIVGREQMLLGREMAWLRVEVYDEGEEAPDVRFLPMLCQQCDNAPCEPVCPVFATYHNPEGLNAQVYNRCVGTRYCSNNCPYKVRRFNWLQPRFPEPLNRQLNPNVTVRDAGVMEKCTFCVQRIQAAKFRADDEGRALRDGDVVPACAQTCPTEAITFGDTNDPDSRVSAAAADARAYAVLEHLNTQPAVRYLKKITVGRSA